MNCKIKKISIVGMLCAIAYVAVVVGRIPLVLFLKYDPKDIIIALSGLIFGPFTSFSVAFIVSLIEMFTISENGVLGFLMNIISSCSFACTAAFIYQKKHKLSGAIITTLRHSNLIEPNKATEKAYINIGVILVALLIITTCILLILSLKGIF